MFVLTASYVRVLLHEGHLLQETMPEPEAQRSNAVEWPISLLKENIYRSRRMTRA